MITTQYKLVRPKNIESYFKSIEIKENEVLVKPTMMSICKADMRYFFGLRDMKTLKKRLPLTLIHEAVGVVLYDPKGVFQKGDKVVLVPNIPGKETEITENYRRDSRFRSSTADGYMQEALNVDRNQVVKYEDEHDEIVAFSEFMSVGVHAVQSFMKKNEKTVRSIGVWGDGGLGYIVSALLRYYMPEVKITVIGVDKSKLELFSFANERYCVDEVSEQDLQFDAVFECVGGKPSEDAVEQMIDTVQSESIMMLLGVSEHPIAINTRMVLEKGLTLIGRSRSGKSDFEEIIRILESDRKFLKRMKKMISAKVKVESINDVNEAFELAKAVDYKVVIEWNI